MLPRLLLALLPGLLAAFASCASADPNPGHSPIAKAPAIVLVIDDLGNNRARGLRAVSLHGDLTYAILPHTPFAAVIAQRAQQANKETIVHVPMSSVHGNSSGPGELSEHMTNANFVTRLNDNLGAIPNARGLNNHMGSALTQNNGMMNLMMSVVAEHDLYFIDSRTSKNTVAALTAEAFNIKHLSRDIFLDNSRKLDDIHRQFQKLLKRARKNGIAVGIGHPYPNTLDYLEAVLPTLQAMENVRLISGSAAIAQRYPAPDQRLAADLTFR